jgi:putative glycosyltransferase
MSVGYRDALVSLRESNIFLAGLFAWTGFRQVSLMVPKGRRAGASSYGLLRLLRLFISGITSFSSYPLWIVFVLGAILTVLSFSAGSYLIVRKLLNPGAVLWGYASIVVSVWFMGGLIISFLGIIGLYLAGIFIETKRRPQYIVRQVYSASQSLVRTAGVGMTKWDSHEF